MSKEVFDGMYGDVICNLIVCQLRRRATERKDTYSSDPYCGLGYPCGHTLGAFPLFCEGNLVLIIVFIE
jgi:hypothetical protein